MAGEPGLPELLERTVAIRWIAFDVVGTLIFPVPPVWAVYHRVSPGAPLKAAYKR